MLGISRFHLKRPGLMVRIGMVDSTIVAAPNSTKNRANERDPERKSTRNGNVVAFRYEGAYRHGHQRL